MKRSLLIALLLFTGSLSAFAQGQPGQAASTPPAAQQQAAPATSAPQIDPQKEADIRQLLTLTETDTLVRETMQRSIENMRPVLTNALPPGAYREQLVTLFFQKLNSKIDPKQLVEMAVPLYDQNFTDADIKGLIQFYQTPLGQKALKALPRIMVNMQTEAQAWGAKLGQESMQEVLAEHPDLAQELEKAREAQQQ